MTYPAAARLAIIERIDLVIPAGMITDLRIPPLSITTGTPDPEWTDVPQSRRLPIPQLPVDPRTARSLRRHRRLAPWSPWVTLVAVVTLVLQFALFLRAGSGTVLFFPAVAIVVALWSVLERRGLPARLPHRTRSGDLRIPDVPVEVAGVWVEQNPGVLATGEPEPPAHSRRFYAFWAAGLLTAATALFLLIANNGREDAVLLLMLVPTLFFFGLWAAARTLPRPSGAPARTFPPGAL
ncbi:hypothetical protein AB0C07_12530 [Actinoplanes missouriensis]|uniref:hypothetical protein n=1 Tax=Actinoplanes missouriensis TaxID=1866 RepID=UPI0033C09EEA